MSRPPQKPMIRVHAELQKEILDAMTAIKLHYLLPPQGVDEATRLARMQNAPSWGRVVELLSRTYKALDEQQFSPIKYKEET